MLPLDSFAGIVAPPVVTTGGWPHLDGQQASKSSLTLTQTGSRTWTPTLTLTRNLTLTLTLTLALSTIEP